MKRQWIPLSVFVLAGAPSWGRADQLGAAESFAVLGGSTVTSIGPTVLAGDLGVWPSPAITGFPPGIVNGKTHAGDAAAQQAQVDVATAYNTLVGMPLDQDLTGEDLGARTLHPGVYRFASTAQLTGALTLDGLGDPDALFVFQIGSTLTTASSSSVTVVNADDRNVFWQVGSSATLGTETDFVGSIVALTSISLGSGADILSGRALAREGAVTMDGNEISIPSIPEPATAVLFGCGLAGLMAWGRKSVGGQARVATDRFGERAEEVHASV